MAVVMKSSCFKEKKRRFVVWLISSPAAGWRSIADTSQGRTGQRSAEGLNNPAQPSGFSLHYILFYSQGLCNHCTQLVLYPLRTIWILLGVSLLGLSDLSGSWRNKNKRKDKWSGCEGKQRSSAGPCVSSMLCCGAWLQWAVSHLHMRMISETVITLSRTPTMCNCGKWCKDDSSNKILFACKINTEMCNENMDFNLCSLILRGNWHILIFKSVI